MIIDWRFEVSKSFLLRMSIKDEIDPKIRKKARELYKFMEVYKIEKLKELEARHYVPV